MNGKSFYWQRILTVFLVTGLILAFLIGNVMQSGAKIELNDMISQTDRSESSYAGMGSEKIFCRTERADEMLLAAKPGTLPQGNAYSEVRTIGDAENTITTFENDDWDYDTFAAEYGSFQRADGTSGYYVVPAGGYFAASAEFWINAVPLESVAGVMFYIDFSELFTKEGVGVGLQIGTSAEGTIWDIAQITRYNAEENASGYYYDYLSGQWINVNISNGSIALPDGYAGWIYFPLQAYAEAEIDGVKTAIGSSGKSGQVQILHLTMPIGDCFETASQIVFDDISFVIEAEQHVHEYAFVKTVEPTCTENGADILQCECGQVQYENVTAATGHSLTDWKDVGDGLAYSVCDVCGAVQTEERAGAAAAEEIVTVTFDYGKAGGQTVKKFPKGYTLRKQDIPNKFSYGDQDVYQFICWTLDQEGIQTFNPVGVSLTEGDIKLYAQYTLCSYDMSAAHGKFMAMTSDVSFNGGPYCVSSAYQKTVVLGHSNYSLWHSMESYFASYGMDVINNSIAGGTTYNYIEYLPNLILRYQPKVAVIAFSSNDVCYHQMTDKKIQENFTSIYETIRQLSPQTIVVFASGVSLMGRPEYKNNVIRMNEWIYDFCEKNEMLEFMDCSEAYEKFMAEHVYPDGWDFWTHMDQEGLQQVVGESMLRTLREIEERYGLDL